MTKGHPSLPERRTALVRAARHVTAESGTDAGSIVERELADEIAAGMTADVADAIDRRTASAATIDELVDGLIEAVLETARAWRDGLALANIAVERIGDFDHWAALLEPWLTAVERAIRRAQARGLVRADVDPRTTALVLRDALDRTAKVAIRFERDGYREATAALVRAALRV
jgi:hypothetical protein